MEGNTQQQIATDLKTILPEHSPRKVSVTGCHSDKCGNNGNSFVSNLKESLQTKGIPTEVEGVTSTTLSSPYLLLSLAESLLVASVMILSVPTL
jgi:hypothetical protein